MNLVGPCVLGRDRKRARLTRCSLSSPLIVPSGSSSIDYRSPHSLELEKNNQHLWRSLNRSSLHHHRTRLIDNLVDLESRGVMNRYGKGRGIGESPTSAVSGAIFPDLLHVWIAPRDKRRTEARASSCSTPVFTAGNADTLNRVIYTLRMLRKTYHSTLPVQIYHFPSEKPPADSDLVKEALELGAELVEAKGTSKDPGRRKNYHLKAIAIVQCPWREVLYLDSDNIPTRDPEYMFEAEPFKVSFAFHLFPLSWRPIARLTILSNFNSALASHVLA